MKTFLVVLLFIEPQAVAGGGLSVVQYHCRKGTKLSASYSADNVQLWLNGKFFYLKTAISASGARYVGGGITWWTKGNEGSLYKGTNLNTMALRDTCSAGQ